MNVIVSAMDSADLTAWMTMRAMLWPDTTQDLHRKELEAFLQRGNFWGLLAETPNGDAAGFAEVAIRDYANGCVSRPVAFLEGIWVKPQLRRQGIGAQLLKATEAFLIVRGISELGSDALIDNQELHSAHRAWGFSETERVVYFRKSLEPVSVAEPKVREAPRLK